jgi:hypothetical protein
MKNIELDFKLQSYVNNSPKLRMLISPVRSGSTAFLHTISQHPETETATFLMKNDFFYQNESRKTDYSIYTVPSQKKFIIYKATIGFKSHTECTYTPFRSTNDILQTRPLFMFRDPTQTFNSWKKMKWGNLDLFITAYQHVYKMYRHSVDQYPQTRSITYEHLSNNPECFDIIANYWGLSPQQDIYKWKSKPGESTVSFYADFNRKMKRKFLEDIDKGFYSSILEGPQEFCFKKSNLIISHNETARIKNNLGHIFKKIKSLDYRWGMQSDTQYYQTNCPTNKVRLCERLFANHNLNRLLYKPVIL